MPYTDSSGNEFESFSDACRYYGVDTPEQAAAEEACYAELEADADLADRQTDALLPYRLAPLLDDLDDCPF
jgi:hypothetical protein